MRRRFVGLAMLMLAWALNSACQGSGTAVSVSPDVSHSSPAATSPVASAEPAASPTAADSPLPAVVAPPSPQPTPSGRDFSNPWPAGSTIAVYDDIHLPTHVVHLVGIAGGTAQVLAQVTLAARGFRGPACPACITVMEAPYISTTNSTVYMLDGDSVIKAVGRDGVVRQVTSIQKSVSAQFSFAVSPDDARIAIGLEDITQRNVNTVYVENLGGGQRVNLLSAATPPYYWPLAWHAGQIVLSSSRGDTFPALNPYFAFGYALMNPSAGARPITLGNGDCTPSGTLVAAGSACLKSTIPACIENLAGSNSPSYYNSCMRRLDWSGKETVFLMPKGVYESTLIVQYASLTVDGSAIWTDQLGRLEQPVSSTHGGNDFLQGTTLVTPRIPCMGWIDGAHFSFTQVYPDGVERVRIIGATFPGVPDAGPGLPGSSISGILAGTVPTEI